MNFLPPYPNPVLKIDELLQGGVLGSSSSYKLVLRLQKLYGKIVTLSSSGTSGLHCVLNSLDIKGKTVGVSPVTFPGVVSAIIHSGAIPIFCDVDRFGKPNFAQMSDCDYSLPVHLYGFYHGELDNTVVHDAAQCFGIKDFSTKAPSVLSLSYGKYPTCAEGGFIIDTKSWETEISAGIHGKDKYSIGQHDVISVNLKSTLSPVSSAIVLSQLSSYSTYREENKKIKTRIVESLNPYVGEENVIYNPEGSQNILAVSIDNRQSVIDKMKERGVPFYLGHKPLNFTQAFENIKISSNNISDYWERILLIPSHQGLTEVDIETLLSCFK